MPIEILLHARIKMEKYDLAEELINRAIANPTSITRGHSGREIYQLGLNGKILRIVVETDQAIKRVITVYKVRRERYEI